MGELAHTVYAIAQIHPHHRVQTDLPPSSVLGSPWGNRHENFQLLVYFSSRVEFCCHGRAAASDWRGIAAAAVS